MTKETKYYKLWISLNKKTQGMVSQGRQGDIDVYAFDKDQPINHWPSNIICPMKVLGILDDIFIPDLGLWAVSNQARSVIERFDNGEIQYLPVSVIDVENGKEIGPYWILNVLKVVEAVDYEHTRWVNPVLRERDEYPSLNIFQEALLREAVIGVHIFRVSIFDKSDRGIYVSSILKRSLEKDGASKGFSFIRVPVY